MNSFVPRVLEVCVKTPPKDLVLVSLPDPGEGPRVSPFTSEHYLGGSHREGVERRCQTLVSEVKPGLH